MHTSIRVLLIFALFFNFFSCARREQALYQRTQREQFTKVTPPIVRSEAVELSSPDTSQAITINEPADISASTATSIPVGLAKPTRVIRSTTAAPVSNGLTDRKQTHVKKAQLRKALLKKLVADTPGSTSGLAIASLVCGILSVFILAVLLGPLAVIFGAVALSQIRKNPEIKGRGLAIAGLVIGIVATVIIIVALATR